MKILYADEFVKQLKSVPDGIKRLLKRQERIFKLDWHDPRLHAKKLKGDSVAFSFRITRRYRVLFTFVDADTALFAAIGHRKDIYR